VAVSSTCWVMAGQNVRDWGRGILQETIGRGSSLNDAMRGTANLLSQTASNEFKEL